MTQAMIITIKNHEEEEDDDDLDHYDDTFPIPKGPMSSHAHGLGRNIKGRMV